MRPYTCSWQFLQDENTTQQEWPNSLFLETNLTFEEAVSTTVQIKAALQHSAATTTTALVKVEQQHQAVWLIRQTDLCYTSYFICCSFLPGIVAPVTAVDRQIIWLTNHAAMLLSLHVQRWDNLPLCSKTCQGSCSTWADCATHDFSCRISGVELCCCLDCHAGHCGRGRVCPWICSESKSETWCQPCTTKTEKAAIFCERGWLLGT